MRTRYRKRAGRFSFNNSFRPGSSRSRFARSNPLWAVRSLAACKAQEVCSQWCTHILYILSLVLRKGPGSAITLRRTGAFSFVILRPPTVPAMPKKASFMGWLLRIWRPSCPGNGNGTIPFPGSSSANFDCFWSVVLPHTASCAFTAMPVERIGLFHFRARACTDRLFGKFEELKKFLASTYGKEARKRCGSRPRSRTAPTGGR